MTSPGATRVTVIIPCGKDKAAGPQPAGKLYTGAMFGHTMAAALAVAGWCAERGVPARVLILSARHGLVTLEEVLDPYDLTMREDGSVTPAVIAAQARDLGIAAGEDVLAFLPRAYLARLQDGLRGGGVTARSMYQGGGGIGYQRHVNKAVRARPGSCFQSRPVPGEQAGGALAEPAEGAR